MKNDNKFKLGKIQKAWIKSLRDHPDRQHKGSLGIGNSGNYKACCLGELLITKCRIGKKKIPFSKRGILLDGKEGINCDFLDQSYKKLGLFDEEGWFYNDYNYYHKKNKTLYNSLYEMNDGGVTWPEIADFVEQYPEKVFCKSV